MLPSFASGRIYALDVQTDPRAPTIAHTVEAKVPFATIALWLPDFSFVSKGAFALSELRLCATAACPAEWQQVVCVMSCACGFLSEQEILEKTGLSWPHTAHCLGTGEVRGMPAPQRPARTAARHWCLSLQDSARHSRDGWQHTRAGGGQHIRRREWRRQGQLPGSGSGASSVICLDCTERVLFLSQRG